MTPPTLYKRATGKVYDRATGEYLGRVERDSYPNTGGGSETVAWTAIAPDGKRSNEFRLSDARETLWKWRPAPAPPATADSGERREGEE